MGALRYCTNTDRNSPVVPTSSPHFGRRGRKTVRKYPDTDVDGYGMPEWCMAGDQPDLHKALLLRDLGMYSGLLHEPIEGRN
ncbi:MAG: hypothetical protein OXD44_06195 [Gammaproteobacteria bacterium]|nr:hypothetical protein [Gammaproteobacteria bacterium]